VIARGGRVGGLWRVIVCGRIGVGATVESAFAAAMRGLS